MLKISYRDDTRLYSNILISHTLCIILTIIILSATLYINFEEIGLNLIYNSMKAKLRHIAHSAEEMNENARNLCLQIWFDRDIQKILYNLPENVSELDNALNRLSLYKTANNLTNSLYIFNSTGNVVFTSRSGEGILGRDSFYDDEIVMLLDNFGAYQKLKPIPRKLKYVYPVEEIRIPISIVLPLSKPALATVSLFIVLQFWKDWWLSLLFINKESLVTLQYLLYKMMRNMDYLRNNVSQMVQGMIDTSSLPTETMRMAMCMVAAGPMLIIFPFFQKYFVRGLTVGAVKG